MYVGTWGQETNTVRKKYKVELGAVSLKGLELLH